ncbi:phospholipase D family protein [Marinihelvus fidelis]|uniref:Phospholipase D family protein n=1 Tax=Marinihelvus fidelis TaxID=2613842 RepID=A0A5N0T9H2_9GAMM|nr:phospholipase D family protein [Marinihelvus fidelis]KAA9131421.1 phospholipase D family protein [Marinihelvus fidelis]
MHAFRSFPIALLALLLGACASLPEDLKQVPSQAWPQPANTALGRYFDQAGPTDQGKSGVVALPHPRHAFMARYALAAQAEHTLDMQYYLWKGDTAGELLLLQALAAADRGVQVRLLIDDIYHHGRDQVYATIDRHPNVQVRVFNPIPNRGLARNLGFAAHKSKLNHRMHNKIFLVDNAAAILGGRNIGDDYFGVDPKLNFNDLDALAVGPVARQAGDAFDLYWNNHHAVPVGVLYEEDAIAPGALDALRERLETAQAGHLDTMPYQVPLEGDELYLHLDELSARLTWAPARVVVDPVSKFEGSGASALADLVTELSKQASEQVTVQTAYLIPSDEGIAMARDMHARGVRIRMMTNSMQSNNHLSVHAFYMKYRKEIIESGVELYELRADSELLEFLKESEDDIASSHAGLHTKAFVVDRQTSVIGSYNMDPRSRVWNSEIALVVEGEAFADTVLDIMNRTFEPGNAYRLTVEDGDLLWTIDTPDGQQTWDKDPGSTAWRRFLARITGWIPIENEL